MANLILPDNLQEALIQGLPASGYYIPSFITPKEEAHLIEKVSTGKFQGFTPDIDLIS